MSKPLSWLAGEIKTPPMSIEARREFGYLLRMLQEGEKLLCLILVLCPL